MLQQIVKVCLLVTLCMSLHTCICAQLYMPRDVKKAYEKGTRSFRGIPGKNYWQNNADYYIDITMQPPARSITAQETIVYRNRSNDTCNFIFVKLFANAHMPGVIRYEDVGEGYLTSGIHIDSFAINNKAMAWQQFPFHYTMQLVSLPQPLLPHDSITLYFKWHYDISLTGRREGMIDSTSWFLAYFYPRVAVYDDYNGWDRSDFTEQQEFYNDFNNYSLKVTVPEEFTVWATGSLFNAKDVLSDEQYKLCELSRNTDTIVRILSAGQIKKKEDRFSGKSRTWHWTAGNVPDIAFAVSDHFCWDGTSVVVDSAANRRAWVQTVYNDTSRAFIPLAKAAKHAIRWYSTKMPAVPYPYPSMTVVQGYANMEYPMMANVEANGGEYYVRYLAEHEIAHTYFPFLTGINESRYAFMDEGWATFLELLIGRSYKSAAAADDLFKDFRVNLWIGDNAADEDLPVITPSSVLRDASYINNAYGKPALAYLALHEMLGEKLFLRCLHGFIARWQGRHPLPWDFFYTFNDLSGKDLNWFWNNWFFSNYYLDYSLGGIRRSSTGYTIEIINKGGFAAPLTLRLNYGNGKTENCQVSPAVWENAKVRYLLPIKTTGQLQSVEIESGVFVDATPADNRLVLNK